MLPQTYHIGSRNKTRLLQDRPNHHLAPTNDSYQCQGVLGINQICSSVPTSTRRIHKCIDPPHNQGVQLGVPNLDGRTPNRIQKHKTAGTQHWLSHHNQLWRQGVKYLCHYWCQQPLHRHSAELQKNLGISLPSSIWFLPTQWHGEELPSSWERTPGHHQISKEMEILPPWGEIRDIHQSPNSQVFPITKGDVEMTNEMVDVPCGLRLFHHIHPWRIEHGRQHPVLNAQCDPRHMLSSLCNGIHMQHPKPTYGRHAEYCIRPIPTGCNHHWLWDQRLRKTTDKRH